MNENLKHTPGPWKLFKNNDNAEWVRLPYFYIQKDFCDSKEKCDIAEIHYDSHDYNYEGHRIDYQEAKANARLIACAPELLKALIKYRNYIPDTFERESGIAYIDGLIRKATGMKIEDIVK